MRDANIKQESKKTHYRNMIKLAIVYQLIKMSLKSFQFGKHLKSSNLTNAIGFLRGSCQEQWVWRDDTATRVWNKSGNGHQRRAYIKLRMVKVNAQLDAASRSLLLVTPISESRKYCWFFSSSKVCLCASQTVPDIAGKVGQNILSRFAWSKAKIS